MIPLSLLGSEGGRGRRRKNPLYSLLIYYLLSLFKELPQSKATSSPKKYTTDCKASSVDILSDMCGNASGNRDRDIACSFELCNAALIFAQREFARCVPRGPHRGARKTLVMKFFADPEFDVFRRTCQEFFNRVDVFKPKSSRSDSSESYLVCMGYRDAGAPTKDAVHCNKPKSPHLMQTRSRVQGHEVGRGRVVRLGQLRGRNYFVMPFRAWLAGYYGIITLLHFPWRL